MFQKMATAWLLLLLSAAIPAHAAPVDELLAALADIHQVQGRFQQLQYDQQGLMLAESSGSFRLLRPGFFAWEIESPDSQLVIADPEYIWHHDRDLETVTRRPVSASGQLSPLQVLGGDASVLREAYIIAGEGEVFTLEPRDGDPGFRHLTLTLAPGGFSGMEIIDNLNQRLVISFSELDPDTPLVPADFAFTPPEGADLFFHDD